MFDRLRHRDVDLPSREAIEEERRRRLQSWRTGLELPEDWNRLRVCGPWIRLEEKVAVLDLIKRDGAKGSGPLTLETEAFVELVHRRATIRYLLGVRAQSHGEYPLPPPDCIDTLDRRGDGRERGCVCLVDAVERAAETEVDMARAVTLARGLARRAHRATLALTRPQRRRARRARRRRSSRLPTSLPVTGAVERRAAASLPDAGGSVEVERVRPVSRSVSPAAFSLRAPLTDAEVESMNWRLGVSAPRSRVDDQGRVLWDE